MDGDNESPPDEEMTMTAITLPRLSTGGHTNGRFAPGHFFYIGGRGAAPAADLTTREVMALAQGVGGGAWMGTARAEMLRRIGDVSPIIGWLPLGSAGCPCFRPTRHRYRTSCKDIPVICARCLGILLAPMESEMTMQTALTDYATETESTRAAAERAIAEGLTLGKYADPTEDAREGLTADEAVAVAREDASLVYVVRAEVRS